MKRKLFYVLIIIILGACSSNRNAEDELTEFSAKLKPLHRILDKTNEGWTVWTCSPVYGPDGKVHVVYEQWEHGPEWEKGVSGSVKAIWLMHAVADQPEGPYTTLDTILAPSFDDRWDNRGGGSPQLFHIDEKYVIVYDGVYRDGDWSNYTRNIGMLISETPNGPWTRVSDTRPIISTGKDTSDFDHFLACNPSLVKHPDGRYFIYYKGRRGTQTERKIGLAIAENLQGPYKKYKGNPIMDYFGERDFEDPYVWYEDGKFKMLAHDLSIKEHGLGLYFESKNGIDWKGPAKGYPSAKELWGEKHRLERPVLLFKNGKPEYMFANLGAWTMKDGTTFSADYDTTYSGFIFKVMQN